MGGACWSDVSENWKCIAIGESTIPGLAKGDCKAAVVLDDTGEPTKHFFDGLCQFAPEHQLVYKCDTVSNYHITTGLTCGQHVDPVNDKACFSLKHGVQW